MDGELSQQDQTALGWAVSTESPTGRLVAERLRRGEQPFGRDDVARIRQEWNAAGRPEPRVHVHRTRVELADGTSVTAVSFMGDDSYTRDPAPAYGLYLDARWDPPWPHEHAAWPDFGVPGDAGALRVALVRLFDRARAGERVEIGCLGGHGRTGTALACLAVLTGVPADQAVDWVRATYCPKAVETDAQRTFVETFPP
jgi:hypothetical protein